ncbi:protein SPMIP2-like [Glandiceps talaboti]
MSVYGGNSDSRGQSRATGYSEVSHGQAVMTEQRLPIEMDGTRGEMVFGGPSNVGQHRVTHVVDHNVFLGIGQASTEKTSELRYISRAPVFAPTPRHERVGEVGWNYNQFKHHTKVEKRKKPIYGPNIE